MAGDYLKQDDTNKCTKEENAVSTSAGAGDSGKIPKLNASGLIDDTMLAVGPETIVVPAKENLAANDVINIFDDSGTTKARKADADDATKPVDGFVKAAVTAGNNATVYLDGILPGTGLTVGSKYFLSTSAGTVTTTPPTGAGNVWQFVGFAIDTTKIRFAPEDPITRI